MSQYKDINTYSLKNASTNLRSNLSSNSNSKVISDINSGNIIKSASNRFFINTLNEINNYEKKLQSLLKIYDQMVEIIKQIKTLENEYQALKEELQTLDPDEDKAKRKRISIAMSSIIQKKQVLENNLKSMASGY